MFGMSVERFRRFCLSLPYTTETVQWGADLVFKIGGKMYAVVALEPSEVWASFKCTPEKFAELVEREGIVPAPYLARASWVGLQSEDALRPGELEPLLREAYGLVLAKLPKKVRDSLASSPVTRPSRARRTR
jgi:predicted DNA-binding protein (MmcQ/YjbR family)